MSRLIQQRTAHDCAVCCLAMALGRVYETTLIEVGDTFDPERGMRYVTKALERLGLSYTFDNGEPTGDFVNMYRGHIMSPQFFRSLAWGRRALMSVPSLNFPGESHMVYWNGDRLLDPSALKVYERWDQLLPEELTLFRETRP
jgi:hypothetical protein